MKTISAVKDEQGQVMHYVDLFSDITAQKEYLQQLEGIAHYDALTSLPNRVLLSERLHNAISHVQERGTGLVVVYLDLDGFKAINDNHGHDVGDQLLVILANRMQKALRAGDTISRLGGDEFVAVLGDLEESEESLPIIRHLLDAVAQPVQVGVLSLQVSGSLGISHYPQQEDVGADQLLRQADQAMYQAKLSGKNRYHMFDAEHDRTVRGYHESLERIRQALTDREFVLYYQPKVNMRSGKVIGAEALIRWIHPEQGLLSPSVFLPVIAEHPLTIELGEWVIATALAQLDAWQTAGLDFTLSVNVDGPLLQYGNFTQTLKAMLEQYPDVNPGKLELEVLESSALEDTVHISEVMHACGEIGVRFALDDFGTGYSSLTYLKRLPVTQLKVDKSFVRDMLDDPEDLAILHGVFGLSSAFGRQPIAEGVESVAHGEMLLQLGCELGQGYGIAPPMPAEEFCAWAAGWSPPTAWKVQRRLSRDDLPLLFASVEHRAWVRAVEQCIRGERTEYPPMNLHECRFGHWLDNEGKARHGDMQAFQSICRIHLRIHTLACALQELHLQGYKQNALERIEELYDLRDMLLKQLALLVKDNRHLILQAS